LPGDLFYKLLIKNEKKGLEKYWRATGGQSLSDGFKELFLRMVHVDPS